MATRSKIIIVVAALAAALSVAYVGYVVGVNGAVARGAVVNAMFVREEAKCMQSGDIECLRAHWRLRAGAAAESARRSIGSVGTSAVDPELRAYVQWVEQLPPLSAASR